MKYAIENRLKKMENFTHKEEMKPTMAFIDQNANGGFTATVGMWDYKAQGRSDSRSFNAGTEGEVITEAENFIDTFQCNSAIPIFYGEERLED